MDVSYTAGGDKWWIVYNIIGVNVLQARFGATSSKTWALQDDGDGNGVPSAGDTIRYTIHLENTGTADGTANIDDTIPAEAASWAIVDDGGGVNGSTATSLVVSDLVVPMGASTDVIFDVVLAAVPDETTMYNVAYFDALPHDSGMIVATGVTIRRDGDGDTVFDNDDNCPTTPNTTQTDTDGDFLGDACDVCANDPLNDPDGDGACESTDNCPGLANPTQQDSDNDGAGDDCDSCPYDPLDDIDGDLLCANLDNCPVDWNPTQANTDGDSLGDVRIQGRSLQCVWLYSQCE